MLSFLSTSSLLSLVRSIETQKCLVEFIAERNETEFEDEDEITVFHGVF